MRPRVLPAEPIRFLAGRKTDVLYAAMPAYGVLLPALPHFLEIRSGYDTVANPAFATFYPCSIE